MKELLHQIWCGIALVGLFAYYVAMFVWLTITTGKPPRFWR